LETKVLPTTRCATVLLSLHEASASLTVLTVTPRPSCVERTTAMGSSVPRALGMRRGVAACLREWHDGDERDVERTQQLMQPRVADPVNREHLR
jgi:hypothetical protein